MDKEKFRRLYGLFIASNIKYYDNTPPNIDEMISDWYYADDGGELSPPPASLGPYTESIKIFKNIRKLTDMLTEMMEEDPESTDLIIAEFDEMGEDVFIEFYRNSRKGS